MRLGFLIFFVVLLALLTAINLFVHRRLSRGLSLGARPRRALGLTLGLGMAAMVVGRLLGKLDSPVPSLLATAGAVVQLAALVAFAILALERSAAGLFRGTRWLAARVGPADGVTAEGHQAALSPAAAEEESEGGTREASARRDEAEPAASGERSQEPLPRRTFLEAAAATSAVTLGGGSSLYGTVFGRHDYAIEEVPIVLEKLSPRLEGFTIAQLSDVHFGAFVDEPEMRAGVELVARVAPDVIVLTGDLVDHDPRFAALLGRFARKLSDLAPVLAIPGNHDHYTGLDQVLAHLRAGGAEVLLNEHRLLGERGIVLAGVDDVWARRHGGGPDLERALFGAPPDAPRILLCHNPVYFPQASDRVDLQLSGHTHGGQFNPGVRLADLVLPYGYVAGRYERGSSQLYVNRGFGTAGPPARLGAAPEITKIVLTTRGLDPRPGA